MRNARKSMRAKLLFAAGVTAAACILSHAEASGTGFVNWESPHVHPIDVNPKGDRLLAVNTADGRLEIFDISTSTPVSIGSVPVGLDPVSVRARDNLEAWVVNSVSDTISVVNISTMNVTATLATNDEPADVIFAGTPTKAFVSCTQTNTVMVFDPANLSTPPTVVSIAGEDPKALAVSQDSTKVYVAIFSSGNRTTILGSLIAGRPNPVNDRSGPYRGANPPPNSGNVFVPPQNPANGPPPEVGIIVRKNRLGRWVDDNVKDWTNFVSGSRAENYNRLAGWDVQDNDLAIIDTTTLGVSYVTDLMNLNMALSVIPSSGKIAVVGTEATNDVRFESNLKARFVRVKMALVSGTNPTGIPPTIFDMNPHLDYSDTQIARQADPATADQALRDQSIGDPRAVVWNSNGSTAYVAGMGSNNVVLFGATGGRLFDPIRVGDGPTGLCLVSKRSRLYVMNKFEGSISEIDTVTRVELSRTPFFDPTPAAIKNGRKFLYNTQQTSGLGHVACGSCHVDARMDRLAWDLGDPAGSMKTFDENCVIDTTVKCPSDFHPMKGPMVTQTFQDIIGKEPHHWRGDREGLEAFNQAFQRIQGDDVQPTATEMQQFEDFLATIHFPPNPFRNFDNTLPTDLPLVGHYATGDFAGTGGLLRGEPLPNGNAVAGLDGFRTRAAHDAGGVEDRTCVSCHTLPVGVGPDSTFNGDFPNSGVFEPYPVGVDGEHHHAIVNLSLGSFKVPQLRNEYQKAGFTKSKVLSPTGFGHFHNGIDSLEEFVASFVFFPTTDQEVADLVAFLLAFSGSDLPVGSTITPLEPPGPSSQDVPASVGAQVTVTPTNKLNVTLVARLNEMMGLADAGKVAMIAKGKRSGAQHGYVYIGGGVFQSDHLGETASATDLRLGVVAGGEMTFTIVPAGTETRIGIDRDADGIYDGDDVP